MLIYVMMLLNQTVLLDAFGGTWISVITITVSLVMMLVKREYFNQKILISLGVFLGLFSFSRIVVGGVGIGIWLVWSRAVLVTWIAIACAPKSFLDRLVKLVYWFALISLVLFLVSQINMGIVQKSMVFQYKMRTNFKMHYLDATNFIRIPYDAYGGIVYAVNMTHPTRNCGIYTEPGINQIVLNTAVFILCYMERYLSFDERMKNRMMIILSATVISAQSTQGIVILAIILLSKYVNLRKLRLNGVFWTIALGTGVLITDVTLRGEQSLIRNIVIRKLFTDQGFSLSASSGAARVGTVDVCVRSMLTHPLGIGYDKLMELLNTDVTGFVAASIFQTGAACGVIMFITVIIWMFCPVAKTMLISKKAKVVFIIICLTNYVFQSNEFYPFLISVILVFWNEQRLGYRTSRSESCEQSD